MKYSCVLCTNLSDEISWNFKTEKVLPIRFVVSIGQLGWLNQTHVCPSCSHENSGYELKSETDINIENYEKALEKARQEKFKQFDEYS